MSEQEEKRSEAIERFLAEPEAMQHTPGSAFRAGYDTALADNAERVREAERDQAEAVEIIGKSGARLADAEEQIAYLTAKGIEFGAKLTEVSAFCRKWLGYEGPALERADAAESALADNAERVRELQFDVEQIEKARRDELADLGQKLTWANARIAKLTEQNIAIDEARDAQVTFNIQTVQRADAAESALAEARSIADRPLGTHIDYEPMDMIRDLQKALGTRVHDREPCRCGNVKGLAEARATIERLEKSLELAMRQLENRT